MGPSFLKLTPRAVLQVSSSLLNKIVKAILFSRLKSIDDEWVCDIPVCRDHLPEDNFHGGLKIGAEPTKNMGRTNIAII